MRTQHQVWHHEALIALEPRPRRNRGLDDPLLMDDPFGGLVAATTGWAPRLSTARLLHPARLARLDVRTALQALQPRDLLALLAHRPAEIRNTRKQLRHQSLQLGERQTIQIGRRRHPQNESESA